MNSQRLFCSLKLVSNVRMKDFWYTCIFSFSSIKNKKILYRIDNKIQYLFVLGLNSEKVNIWKIMYLDLVGSEQEAIFIVWFVVVRSGFFPLRTHKLRRELRGKFFYKKSMKKSFDNCVLRLSSLNNVLASKTIYTITCHKCFITYIINIFYGQVASK